MTAYLNDKELKNTYGVRFLSGWRSQLFSSASMKEYVVNESKSEHGKQVLKGYAKVDERNFQLPIGIWASSLSDYKSKYGAFEAELQSDSLHILEIVDDDNETYVFKVSYLSMSEYVDFNGRWGECILRFNEPNPKDRALEE